VNESFLYCFGVAAERHGIELHWLEVMSNHYHAGVRDVRGNYPEFLRYFHSLLARCLNVHLNRRENFWATEQTNVLHLADPDAVFDKQIYGLGNPLNDHLVDTALNWPGVSSLGAQLQDRPIVVRRPKHFFADDGPLPKSVSLRFVRPPDFAALSHDEWSAKISAAIKRRETQAAEDRRRHGIKLLGRKAVRRQSPFSSPRTSAKRRNLRPTVASRNKQRRRQELDRNKAFRSEYRGAYEQRQLGNTAALFPVGTYKLLRQGLVDCHVPPS
jgi:hypothetical protein